MEMEQYLDMFLEESREHLQAMNESLLLLEKEPSNIDTINIIFRSAHTLKGMSATMGFEDMARLTHEMENVLDQARNRQLTLLPPVLDTIFQCLDILESMVFSVTEGGNAQHDVSSILHQFKQFLSQDVPSEGAVEKKEEGPSSTTLLHSYQLAVAKQSIQLGHFVYSIRIVIEKTSVLKSARAYMVFQALESMGEILQSVPSVEEIEQEHFDHTFQVCLVTEKMQEEIEKQVLGISEIESVFIEQLVLDPPSSSTQGPAIVQQNKESEKPAAVNNEKNQPKRAASNKTIRVDIDRLDTLMNLFSEMVIERGRLEQLSKESENAHLVETVEHIHRTTGDMQNLILTLRMVSLEHVFNRFPRMVRDVTKELHKKVNLVIEGAETELDRTVIDEIGDPLVHLLRNSMDHGLETPEERKQAGKPEEGTILLKAYHSGNHVFIEVSDDGRGINRDKVLEKALEKGIISEEQARTFTDKKVYELLFASGFSTASEVSDLSGRGVGLDVVKSKIESLGGMVTVDSTPKQGTIFSIQLPLTLSIISTLLVEIGNETYAVPLNSIMETVLVQPEEILRAHQQDAIDFRGRVIPLVSLKRVFGIPEDLAEKPKEIPVVIIKKGEKAAALMVDGFIGKQEIVLKSLGNYLSDVFAISGGTILGDGQVALIIDCNALIQ